ncbi:MAG: endonuclease V [Nanoarchaeota archaeon]
MEEAELIKRYNIDIEKLKEEQLKLAKQINLSDNIDFSLSDRFGAFINIFLENKILSCVIVCNKNFEVLDMAYFYDKARFPYLSGFRAYRELPAMIEAYNKLNEKPDVVFIPAHGITHPRLGLASHFSLVAGIPAIGVANIINDCEIKEQDIFKNNKKIGKVFISKVGSKPMYISPGNDISINTSYELCKKFICLPHKLPEPLVLAKKYSKEVMEELRR